MLPAAGYVTASANADRDRRIDGVAALLQDRHADVRRLRRDADDHAVLRRDRGWLVLAAAGTNGYRQHDQTNRERIA